jgi:hypothetical protein
MSIDPLLRESLDCSCNRIPIESCVFDDLLVSRERDPILIDPERDGEEDEQLAPFKVTEFFSEIDVNLDVYFGLCLPLKIEIMSRRPLLDGRLRPALSASGQR